MSLFRTVYDAIDKELGADPRTKRAVALAVVEAIVGPEIGFGVGDNAVIQDIQNRRTLRAATSRLVSV